MTHINVEQVIYAASVPQFVMPAEDGTLAFRLTQGPVAATWSVQVSADPKPCSALNMRIKSSSELIYRFERIVRCASSDGVDAGCGHSNGGQEVPGHEHAGTSSCPRNNYGVDLHEVILQTRGHWCAFPSDVPT
jgi:hypothetical protein